MGTARDFARAWVWGWLGVLYLVPGAGWGGGQGSCKPPSACGPLVPGPFASPQPCLARLGGWVPAWPGCPVPWLLCVPCVFLHGGPPRHSSKIHPKIWGCSPHMGPPGWPISSLHIGTCRARQKVLHPGLGCRLGGRVGVVPLPVLPVHRVAQGVALMGVPCKVPWGHAHPELTQVACLQLWARWGASVHVGS